METGPVRRAGTDLVGRLTGAGIQAQQGLPADAVGPHVQVWPLAVVPEPDLAMSAGRPPLRVRIQFLICPTGSAVEVLDQLDRVLAVLAESGPEPSPEPVQPSTWDALGAPPRAAVLVEIPVTVPRSTPAVPRVRHELVVSAQPLRSLTGQVVGPGGVPLAGVRVEAATTGATTGTDPSGRFALTALPATEPVRLRLTGRGLTFHTEVAAGTEEPVVINCQFEEE